MGTVFWERPFAVGDTCVWGDSAVVCNLVWSLGLELG